MPSSDTMYRAAARGQAVCVCMAAVVYVSTVHAFTAKVPALRMRDLLSFKRCLRRGMGEECKGAAPLLRRSREPANLAQRLRSPGLLMAIDAGERVQKILPLYDGQYFFPCALSGPVVELSAGMIGCV